MNCLLFKYNVLLLILFPFCLNSQNLDDLKREKEENLKAIQLTTELLNKTEKRKSNTINDLYILESKIHARNNLIQNLNLEIELNKQIRDSLHTSVYYLERELETLKGEYARTVIQAYKIRNRRSFVMFILSSKNFNQAYKRTKYIQQLLEYMDVQKERILSTRSHLMFESVKLKGIINDMNILLDDRSNEVSNLAIERNSQDKLLKNLKAKESLLKAELDLKKKNLKRLEDVIKKLVSELARRDSNNNLIYKMTPEEKLISENFEKNMGLLPWPTDKGIITGKYGKQKHPVFKNLEINNNGIDIASPKNSKARSIFNGEVKNIVTIPGFHRAIIIKHGNYMTVYANLNQVYVKVGDKVKTKDEIGSIFEGPDDSNAILHFEIWHEFSNLDPNGWITNN